MDERPGSVTKDLIREKAVELFHKKGYHATTMQEIASAVGIVKGGLYYHFPAKQAILEDITNRIETELLHELEVTASSEAPVDERLRQIIRQHVSTVATNLDVAWVILFEQRNLPPEAGAKNAQNNRHFRRLIAKVVVEGVRKGVFASEDPTLTSMAIVGACNWVSLWYKQNGRQNAEQIADHFADFILSGLLARHPLDSNQQIE